MIKTVLFSLLLTLAFQGCSNKEVEKIDYKTQQENSQKALKEL